MVDLGGLPLPLRTREIRRIWAFELASTRIVMEPHHRKTKLAMTLLVVVIVAAPMAAAVAPARASTLGPPSLTFGFFANDGTVLGFNGYLTWGGIYNPISNGSQVYAGAFVLDLYYLASSGTSTITLTVTENGQSTTQHLALLAQQAVQYTVNLPPDNSWTPLTMVVGGTVLQYTVAVPISFLPNQISQVGGLDLLSLAILSEAMICLALAVSCAYACMRRAKWAPKVSLLIWGHVILFSLVGFILFDFQQVDQTFAGWSPLVYAVFLFPVFWLFSLSFFNRAPRAQILRANAPLAGRLSFNSWSIRITDDGKEIIDPSWRGFFARLSGKRVRLVPEESGITMPEPFVADLRNLRVASRRSILRRVSRPSPDKALPTDDFNLIPSSPEGKFAPREKDLPIKLFFTPVGQPVVVNWPRLSMHRDVLVPAEVDKDSGMTLIPEHHERRLTLPHFTDGEAHLQLHSLHFRSAASVVAGWRSAEDLGQVLSDTSLDLESLKADFETQVARKVRQRLLARDALIGRGEDDLDEVEAAQEAERERNTMTAAEMAYGKALVDSRSLSPDTAAQARKRAGVRS